MQHRPADKGEVTSHIAHVAATVPLPYAYFDGSVAVADSGKAHHDERGDEREICSSSSR